MTRTVLAQIWADLDAGRPVGGLSPIVADTLMAVLCRLGDEPHGRPRPRIGRPDRDAETVARRRDGLQGRETVG